MVFIFQHWLREVCRLQRSYFLARYLWSREFFTIQRRTPYKDFDFRRSPLARNEHNRDAISVNAKFQPPALLPRVISQQNLPRSRRLSRIQLPHFSPVLPPSITDKSGLDVFSSRPNDEVRRTLETNLQTFTSTCDIIEIQIVLFPRALTRSARNKFCDGRLNY
jgi:hypothetical protein